MEKIISQIQKRRDVAKIVAEAHRVTADYVRKVIKGERENEDILETYIRIVEQDNLLLKSVNQLVPFNK